MASELVTPSVLVEECCIIRFLAKVKPAEILHFQYHSHHHLHHHRHYHNNNNWQNERMGLSFTIAAGPRQRGHSRVRVPRDSWPYFTLSDSRLPQPGRPGRRIYIPHEQGGPVIPPSTGFPFRRLLRLAGLWWKYSNPPQHIPLITPLHGPPQKTPFPTVPLFSCVGSLLWKRVCLRPVTSVETCLFEIRYLVTGLPATIFCAAPVISYVFI
jgi:hypothetical protein